MDSEIQQYAGDILAHPRFQQLRTFCHHGLDNSVYDHSVAVAEAACQIARLMRLSESETTSVVRAALLHDFFGYDWHGELLPPLSEPFFPRASHCTHARVHSRPHRSRPRQAYLRSVRAGVRSHCTAYVSAGGHAAHANRVDRHRGG